MNIIPNTCNGDIAVILFLALLVTDSEAPATLCKLLAILLLLEMADFDFLSSPYKKSFIFSEKYLPWPWKTDNALPIEFSIPTKALVPMRLSLISPYCSGLVALLTPFIITLRELNILVMFWRCASIGP